MALLTDHVEIEELGNGVFRQTIHQKPIAYRDGGSLRAINSDWTDSGDGTRPHIVTRAPFRIRASNDGMRRIYPIPGDDTRYFEIGAPYIKPAGTWQQVSLGSPTRTGNLLTWTTANANLYVQMAGHFVKLAILLKGGWQPPGGEFAFPVGLTGLTRDGGTILRDGVPVMHARAPHVEDFDNPEDVRPIDLDFVQVNGQWYAHFQLPDLTGMSRPLVDPTFESQPDEADGKDTHLRSVAPTTNYDTLTIDILAESAAGRFRRGLLQFDVSSIPAAAIITSSILRLTCSLNFTGTTIDVHRLTKAWTENEATWNSAATGDAWSSAGGDYDATADDSLTEVNFVSGNAYDFNITTMTQAWVAGSASNFGSLLKMNSESGTSVGLQAHSSSHTTAAQRPKLTIEYTEAAAAARLFMQYRRLRQ